MQRNKRLKTYIDKSRQISRNTNFNYGYVGRIDHLCLQVLSEKRIAKEEK